ncbi:hypothetical protein L2E82_40062 [Cichorium intybus]|uniref:Uncharacterized protein n=1 Tax=Cichorium intybus TaxID=13427 RepID=A0ACB9AJS1_CICIN|nr:hypothetical protein L2E82_40062 [Cichorium intybus]
MVVTLDDGNETGDENSTASSTICSPSTLISRHPPFALHLLDLASVIGSAPNNATKRPPSSLLVALTAIEAIYEYTCLVYYN